MIGNSRNLRFYFCRNWTLLFRKAPRAKLRRQLTVLSHLCASRSAFAIKARAPALARARLIWMRKVEAGGTSLRGLSKFVPVISQPDLQKPPHPHGWSPIPQPPLKGEIQLPSFSWWLCLLFRYSSTFCTFKTLFRDRNDLGMQMWSEGGVLLSRSNGCHCFSLQWQSPMARFLVCNEKRWAWENAKSLAHCPCLLWFQADEVEAIESKYDMSNAEQVRRICFECHILYESCMRRLWPHIWLMKRANFVADCALIRQNMIHNYCKASLLSI